MDVCNVPAGGPEKAVLIARVRELEQSFTALQLEHRRALANAYALRLALSQSQARERFWQRVSMFTSGAAGGVILRAALTGERRRR